MHNRFGRLKVTGRAFICYLWIHFCKLETHENYITGTKYISESPVYTRKEQKLELYLSMGSEKNTTLPPIFLHTGRHLLWMRISKKKSLRVRIVCWA